MFRRPDPATVPLDLSQVSVAALLEGIAAVDDRCHDEALRPALEAALDERGSGVAIVALVRMLSRRAALDPAFRARTVRISPGATPRPL
jgi:hypothetical protein